VFLGMLLLGGDFCGDTTWWGMLVVLFLSLEFSGNFAFPSLYVVSAFLVLVKLCSLVSLSLLLDLFLLVMIDLVVFRCGDGSVCCSCGFSVVPVRNLLVCMRHTNTRDKGDDKWSNIPTRKGFVKTLRR